MDVVLINPGNQHQIYQDLEFGLTAVEPPVWAGLMATYLERHDRQVTIIDADAERLAPAGVAARVNEMRPALVVMVVYGHQPSASTQLMPAAGAICQAIKEVNPGQPIIMVGGHVAALPGRTLLEEAVDYVSTGEGLVTISKLADCLLASGQRHSGLKNVPGLMWLEQGVPHSTQEAPLVVDLDVTMPAVAWEHLPMKRYRAHNWQCFGGLRRTPYAAIYTSLGCPYKCTFCCIQAPFKRGEQASGLARNSYRLWSPQTVADQLEHLVSEYGIRNIKFADEMFVLNKRHVEGICDEIVGRGLDLNIWAYARVDTVRDGMAEKLRAAGFRWLAFGIESANESVRDGVDKSFGEDQMYATLEKVRAADINVIANYIFGLPDDDYTSMRQTLELSRSINAEFANFYSAMAYPGSPLYVQAECDGWQLPTSWSGYSQHSVDSTPLPTKHLTSEQIVAFRDLAFDDYFSNPAYLEMIGNRFGDATVVEVQEMCKIKLERHGSASPD